LSRQSIADLSIHTKTVTSQGLIFAESFGQRTENPRVENSVITPVNMHPEGFDLIGDLFMSDGFFRYGDIPVFFDLTLPTMAGKVC
jgi:hypothetical protein